MGRTNRWGLFVLGGSALLLGFACGDSSSDSPQCVPGEQIACACGGDETGFQVCASDGTYGSCECSGAGGGGAGQGGDGGSVTAAGGTGGDGGTVAGCSPDVDILVVVDNSNSMAQEQLSFVEQVPRLVDALATGDVTGDGAPEFRAARSIRIGIVTSDMGVGGYIVPTCSEAEVGDDGLLRTTTTARGCDASYPAPLSVETSADTDAFAADAACVASQGIAGCGFEQQLEAALKAVSPSRPTAWTVDGYVPPTFVDGTGHGIGDNAGLVRPDSILVVVLLTDEEDCSALDPELFDSASETYTGDLNLRCLTYPEAQSSIERFASGFLGLRRDASHLVYAVIAGVPEGLSGGSAAEYTDILADDRMQAEVDPESPNRPKASCNVPERGLAFPPRRMVEVARELDLSGARTTVGSICQADLTAPIDALLEATGAALDTCDAP